MGLRIYNTLAHKKEPFTPVHEGRVGIYLCGPTVYMNSHIGHAVGPVIFDTVKRYLMAKGYDVTLVLNITDIDDKIINRANAEGVSFQEIAQPVTEDYLENMKALGVVNIDIMPRATEHIPEIVEMTQGLIDKGFAYASDGDVYFDISTARSYGKLSGRQVDDLIAGARVEVSQKKRSPGDFALWKASKAGEPGWPSPWGEGRPGWHIECSVMSAKYLGETFDIHGGGVDLVFPHHENEVLQSESYTGREFARCWMHNGLTTIDGAKMSKSLGNVVELSDLLSKHAPETVRFFILQTHYRSPMDFSFAALDRAKKALGNFHRLLGRIERVTGSDVYADTAAVILDEPTGAVAAPLVEARDAFFAAMDDDFNTARSLAALFDLAAALNREADERGLDTTEDIALKQDFFDAGMHLRKLAAILGILEKRPAVYTPDGPGEEEIEKLVAERARARKERDFTRADEIRASLSDRGVVIEDTPGGTVWRRT